MKKYLYPFIVLPLVLSSLAMASSGESQIESISFAPLDIPQNDQEKSGIRISPYSSVKYKNGNEKKFELKYQILFRNGDLINNKTVGALSDKNGKVFVDKENKIFSTDRIDGNSIIKKGNNLYLLTHFESTPGAIFSTNLKKENQKLTPVDTNTIDFSAVSGTMINCAASRTPWNTHLSAEEDFYFDASKFDPDTYTYNSDNMGNCKTDENGLITNVNNYFCNVVKGMKDDYLKGDYFNPYNYGYIFEVELDDQGKGKVKDNLKHFVMGKSCPEMALTMPDNKTVYITDDGDYRGLFMLVADKEKDLSKGSLFAARWNQLTSEKSGKAKLDWIKLGHSSNRKIKEIIDKKPSFTDIFEVNKKSDCNGSGFKLIKSGDSEPMCLRPKDGTNGSTLSPVFKSSEEAKTALAFLETRRYAAYLGGTVEFRKEEGITYDPERNVIYVAMSEINNSMLDNYKGKEPEEQNHIKLEKNDCGTIYSISLDKNKVTGSKYSGDMMYPLISGEPLKSGDKNSDENYCNTDKIANPDNITYIGNNLLMIAEDSSRHLNNNLWAFDVSKNKLMRVMTAPVGAEFAGAFANISLDKNNFIFVNIQHPLKSPSVNALGEISGKNITDSATKEQKRSYVGYIEGLPSFERK